MVFPVETEERVKRRALNVSRDHLRLVVDISRKISQLVTVFVKGDKKVARELFADITKAQNDVAAARRIVSRELAEIGAILMSREDFFRFTNLTSEIADFCESVYLDKSLKPKQITDRIGAMIKRHLKDDSIGISAKRVRVGQHSEVHYSFTNISDKLVGEDRKRQKSQKHTVFQTSCVNGKTL